MVMLTMFDGLVSMALGPECALLPVERELIDEPLQRMLKRVDPTITGAIEKYTDPLLVCMGLITWGARVWQIQLAKLREARARQEAQKPAAPPAEEAPEVETLPVYDVPAPGVNVIGQVIP